MKKLIVVSLIIFTTNLLSGQIINIPADYTSIQQGINAANNGDTVLVDTGTYLENINFNGKNITVASKYLTTQDTSYITQTIIDANEEGSVVTFNNGEDSTTLLCGFTLQNGYADDWDAGGGICCEDADPQLSFLKIINNRSFLFGGGGVSCENAVVSMTQLKIFNNYVGEASGSGGEGGGVRCSNSEVSLFDCEISGNTGYLGGGIYCRSSDLNLENVVITNNEAYSCYGGSSGSGGGIYYFDSESTIKNVSITNNYSGGSAGGIYCRSSDITFDSINRCSIYSNGALGTKELYCRDSFMEVIVDTFTVLYPTSYYTKPLESFTFDILNAINTQVNSDLYVSPGGDNSNSGLTADDPLQSIEFAFAKIISDSLDRKKIHLLEGTYSTTTNGEAFPVIVPKNVDLVGVADSLVILDGGEVSEVMYLGADVYNISGLTISGGFNWWEGAGLLCGGTQGILKDLIIRDNFASMSGGGIYMGGGASPELINVRVINNMSNSGSGLYITDSNPILKNVIISDNQGSAYADGGGIYLYNSNPLFINCSVISNGDLGIRCSNTSNPIVINTIVWGHAWKSIAFEDHNSPNSITISWSDIEWGEDSIVTNNNGVVYWLEGNIDQDPIFVGSGDHPYQINDNSPCIDAGTPDTTGLSLPADDIIGNKRIWDGDNNGTAIIDMGAYEYGSIPVNIKEPIFTESINEYDLKIFPNPLTQSTTFELELKEKNRITLFIYNQRGKKVETISEGEKEKGIFKLIWDSKNLPTGIYFIKLQTNNGIITQKIIKK